ncbi:YbfB/YjiJ family MFS transporter [Rhizobium halophytocola]|uniref:MFS family arabinose efflux permease n=1 Tax=Rhizobium halophytocola TaxID=735519 RepID=A0ABS4E647_9HYPH|nr:YbfB/YjiJ family MFS transporter [Rhizobium halophytocola]MBP1853388.1 putative MFS family arabinose efflux permease [Rhizobium halophytocola]
MLQRPTASSPASLVPVAMAGALAMASAMGFGRFVFTPILPGMVAGVPLSSSAAGYIASANFVGYLAGAVLASFGWGAGRERQVALTALLISTVMLAAMGFTDSIAAFILIRFVAGLASAYAMIFTSSIVLGHAHARGSDHVPSVHFCGVGLGIALSSLMVYLGSLAEGGGAAAWRMDWFVSAAVTLLLLLVVWRLLPAALPRAAEEPDSEPPIRWRLPLTLLTLSYGLFGFGYVITATFIVTMARTGDAGPAVEFLTWFVTGLMAAASIFAWGPLVRRFGLAVSYPLALIVEAIGVLGSVALPSPYAPLVGGALLGGTFMVVTAHGLRIGRVLAPESPRRCLAVMTAAFGIGQIIGPLVAGRAAEATGSFTLASLLGALALLLAFAAVMSVRRRLA